MYLEEKRKPVFVISRSSKEMKERISTKINCDEDYANKDLRNSSILQKQ